MAIEIRNARQGDRDALVSISTRTIRTSYIPFLGMEAVEKWLAGGTVENYFYQHLADCRMLETGGKIVGMCVAEGALINPMMIDCERHREGFGRTLLAHVETYIFKSLPVMRRAIVGDRGRLGFELLHHLAAIGRIGDHPVEIHFIVLHVGPHNHYQQPVLVTRVLICFCDPPKRTNRADKSTVIWARYKFLGD